MSSSTQFEVYTLRKIASTVECVVRYTQRSKLAKRFYFILIFCWSFVSGFVLTVVYFSAHSTRGILRLGRAGCFVQRAAFYAATMKHLPYKVSAVFLRGGKSRRLTEMAFMPEVYAIIEL